jgi:hypothetical protein
MSQISPPIRIVLVAAVAFLAAWMLFLRPKTEEIPPPAPAATAPAKQPGTTAQSAAGKAVQAAENAKATAESAAKARAGETAAQTAPATAAAKAPAAAAAKLGVDPAALASLPRDVRKALEARKIVVLGFFNRAALDDRQTRKQLEQVHRFHGRVFVHAASLEAVQRYQVITRGVDVSQTPSIVVIDRKMKAQLLTGYVDHVRVEQAIVDAMRRSDMPVVKTAYLRKVNALCGTYAGNLLVAWEPGIGDTSRSTLHGYSRQIDRFAARLSALKAPNAYRGFHSKFAGDVKTISAGFSALSAAADAKSVKRILAVVDKYDKPVDAAEKRFNKLSRQHDMLACMYG